MSPQFIQFTTKDGLTLPGLLYGKKTNKEVVIHLHGNGSASVFYEEKENRFLADALAKKNISILYFNNRGAYNLKKLYTRKDRSGKSGQMKKKEWYGMAHERIKECVEDIDGAIAFLKTLGYKKFYLSGASTGANKICVYDHYKPKNEISKYILLCGGDDTGIYYDEIGKKKFWKLLAESKRKIKAGKGSELIKEILPEHIFAYQGFYDIANPDGDYNVFPFSEVIKKIKLSTKPLFRYFKAIKKPAIVIYGDKDEYSWGDVPRVVDILKSCQPGLDYRIIKGADHGFKGRQTVLAKTVADWL